MTFGIETFGNLRVECHRSSAFRTGSRRRSLDLYFEQFAGDLCREDLDPVFESEGIHLAGSDLCQGEFPASGQGYVGDSFVGDDVVHGESFLGGYQRSFLPTDVFAGDEGLDDGRSRCRGSESGVLHGFAFGFVVEFLSDGLHGRQQ